MNFAQITLGFRGYQDAKQAYTKALELQPNNFEAQNGLAIALRGLEENDKALEAYKKAIDINPSPSAFASLAVTLEWLDEYQHALEAAHEAVKLNPKDPHLFTV